MKELLPGIYQITIPLPGFFPESVNSYLLKSGDGYFLIDTPWDIPVCVDSFNNQLAQIGIRMSDIKNIIITHCHTDHLGMVVRLKAEYGMKIFIHRSDVEFIKNNIPPGKSYDEITDKYLLEYGVPGDKLSPPEVPLPSMGKLISLESENILDDSDEIFGSDWVLKVITTPGHTPGHMALYEPVKKILFSGDMLLPSIATNVAFHVQYMKNPVKQYMNSLDILKGLDINLVLPGHEDVFSNHRQRVLELKKNHDEKAFDIEKILSDGAPRTAYDVSRELSRSLRTNLITWDALGGWARRFAVLQTISYLEEMAYAGKIARFSLDGKIYYKR